MYTQKCMCVCVCACVHAHTHTHTHTSPPPVNKYSDLCYIYVLFWLIVLNKEQVIGD